MVKPEDVPSERPGRAHRHIREAMDLGESEALAVEAPDRDAAALGSQVDRHHRAHQEDPAPVGDTERSSRGRRGARLRAAHSTVTTSTPRARQASTSLAGAPMSVTIVLTWSAWTNDRSAVRCHFVRSTMAITRSQA